MSITTDNRTEQSIGTVEHIDPQALEFEDNVRDEVDLDKEFLASLREHGVIVPIIAIRDAEGRTLVREGQCRTLGAREVGLHSVPVYVVPADADDANTATARRIVEQMVANDRRKDLTNAQRARGIQQLLDTGMSATKVAKKLAMPRDMVNAAGAAAKSATALNALNDGQLNFRQAEALTEFEDDPDAVDRLLRAAHHGPQHFDHAVSSLRTQRETDALYAEAEKVYTEKGFTVLEDRPWWNDFSAIRADYLQTADGERVPDDIEKEPAHWAVYLTEDYGYFDAETGEPVDDADLDEDTRHDEEAEAAEGLRHFSTVTEKTVMVPEWYCVDYAAAGLQLGPSLRDRHPGTPTGATANGDNSPEAVAERQAQQEEAERRERKKVLVLNRLGQAAESVRREYVTKLLLRKTAPKGAATFVAHCLSRDSFILNQNHGSAVTAELLGLKNDREVRELVSDLGTNIDARAQIITLAIVLGALEARTDKSAWRNARAGLVGSQSWWRKPRHLPAALQNSHHYGGRAFVIFVADPRTQRLRERTSTDWLAGDDGARSSRPGQQRTSSGGGRRRHALPPHQPSPHLVWLLKFRVHTHSPDLRRQRRSHSMSIPRNLTFMSTRPGTRIDHAPSRTRPSDPLDGISSRDGERYLRPARQPEPG